MVVTLSPHLRNRVFLRLYILGPQRRRAEVPEGLETKVGVGRETLIAMGTGNRVRELRV